MRSRLPSPLAMAVAVASSGAIIFFAPTPLRVPFAVALALVLPGYLLTLALFPRGSFGRAERKLRISMERSLPSPLAAAVAVASSVVIVLWAPTPLRVPFGVALALVLPGYLLTLALFPRGPFGRAEQTLLSLALSVSLVIVLALLLNVTVGLRAATWAVALVLVDTVAYIAARARSLAADDREPLPQLRVTKRDALFLVVAFALVAIATALAFTPLPARHVNGYTALWIVPVRGGKIVRIGVRSGELRPLAYRLVVRRRDRTLLSRRLRPVEPGTVVRVPVDVPRGGGRITALLFRLNRPHQPYRSVSINMRR